MTRVTIHVTGGIAAYKAITLLRQFQQNGDTVRVAMTAAATKFIGVATFEALTKQPVLTDLWDAHQSAKIAHVELADWTQLAIVVPATANTIAKLAMGVADNAVTSTLLATTAPKLVVPAMNVHMWQNPATQRNVAQLRQDHVSVMSPDTGRLAEGYEGAGRMPEPARIFERAQELINPQRGLQGKTVVITAGGTREDIDPVRFIGNHSSGKMGIALAEAAVRAGATVTLIAGSVRDLEQIPDRVNLIRVTSTTDMAQAVNQAFPTADVLIMAAAVADFQPVNRVDQKIKKDPNHETMTLTLKKTPDILKMVASHKKQQYVVGFAAETQHLLDNANRKLQQKHADMIVANNVSAPGIGFGSDDNQVTILTPGAQPEMWDKMSKRQVAQKLIERIVKQLG